MKNMKIITKLIIGFVIINILIVLILYSGYSTSRKIITVDDPIHYLSSYATFTAILFIAVVSVCVTISVFITKTIKKSLKELTNASHQLAEGKIDITMTKYNNDEFGVLIDDFQKLIDNIRYDAEVAQEVADGNITIDVHVKSEDDILGKALKKLVEQNHHTLSNIKDAAYQVTTSSSQVASASEALAQGSTEQASAIQQITASIADIAERTRDNATQANIAAELMTETIQDVKKGNAEMNGMVEAMQDINRASEGISKIIKVIDDIAFQTNILALNAAVEAARAGDAGKGFAVVAEEVRNLAAKSASAATETAEMIEDSIQKVEIGSRIASETADSLEKINVVAQKSEKIITDIVKASNYQATAIAQIDQAIEQVSQVVQTNSATSEECAAASVELSNQASRVMDMVSVYRLGGHGVSSAGMKNGQSHKYENNADKNEQIISLRDGFGKY